MPHTVTQPPIPFSGNGLISRACSLEAARSVVTDRALKTGLYIAWLRAHGPATDHAAATHFGWGLSSINSIRNLLGDAVVEDGWVREGSGRKRTRWSAA